VTYVVEIHQHPGLGAFILEELFGQLVETFHLVLGLLYDPFQRTEV